MHKSIIYGGFSSPNQFCRVFGRELGLRREGLIPSQSLCPGSFCHSLIGLDC
jgi:hypothetical protein